MVIHVPAGRGGGELPMELRSGVAYDAELLAEVGRRLGPGSVELPRLSGRLSRGGVSRRRLVLGARIAWTTAYRSVNSPRTLAIVAESSRSSLRDLVEDGALLGRDRVVDGVDEEAAAQQGHPLVERRLRRPTARVTR